MSIIALTASNFHTSLFINNCILVQLTVCVYVFSNNTDTEPAVAERLPGEQAPAVVGQRGEGVDDHPHDARPTSWWVGCPDWKPACCFATRPACNEMAGSCELHPHQYKCMSSRASHQQGRGNFSLHCRIFIKQIKRHQVLSLQRIEGGLIKPSEAFVRLVREMEVAFRQLPLKYADYAAFHSAVISNNTPSKFCVLLECVNITAAQKEDLFVRIITLFFVVRMHKKCRQFIERCVQKKLVVQKPKPLRDSI